MNTTTRSIKSDYLSGEEALQAFYQYPIQTPDFQQIIQDKSLDKTDRKLLQTVIREQYEGIPISPATRSNLDKLGEDNSYTITTGHQLVLFGGPMFTTYKVLSTIVLADQLSKENPDFNIIPIFWIHTEDHDFEEINHYFDEKGTKHTYTAEFNGMVGSHILTDEILDIIPTHFSDELKDAYQPGRTMAEAFRIFINHLFGKYGLVILDPNDARLKATFTKVLREEMASFPTQEKITQTSLQLAEAGYSQQITPREINLFYVDENGRDRLIKENGHYEVLDRNLHFSMEEMEQLIHTHPERFSPNVSLRPLFQETILPNLAYFGGWGELSYWLQLKGVFDHFKTNFPLVLPRMSATLFSSEQRDDWTTLGFDEQDIGLPLHELYRKFMPQVWDESPWQNKEEKIIADLEDLHAYIHENISPTLSRSAEALLTKNKKFLQNLKKKAFKEIRNRNPESFRNIEQVKNQIQPEGTVQERTWSLAAFPAIHPATLIDQVKENCQPLNFSHNYLTWK